MQSVAGAWLVLQLSHNSALALALFGAFSYGPVLIFGLYAGTVVDRFAHRDVLLLTQLISLVGAGLYAALTATHVITLPIVLVLAAVLGVNQALYFPARQATVLEMVGRGELVSAVALNSIAFNLARIAGPALGGVVIATLGVAACFWINAITYLGVIAALLTIRRRPLTAGPPQTAVQLIAEALRYVARTPALAGLFALLFVAGTFVQVRAPDRLQGRMVSLYSMLFIGVTPIGNVFAAIVAHFLGPSAAVWLGGALTALAGLAVLAFFLTRRD